MKKIINISKIALIFLAGIFIFIGISKDVKETYTNNAIQYEKESNSVASDLNSLLVHDFNIKSNPIPANKIIRNTEDIKKLKIDSVFINKVIKKKFYKSAAALISDRKEMLNDVNFDIIKHNRLISRIPTKWIFENPTILTSITYK